VVSKIAIELNALHQIIQCAFVLLYRMAVAQIDPSYFAMALAPNAPQWHA
jgi:hypothetical protein